jgi:hypothetical protein
MLLDIVEALFGSLPRRVTSFVVLGLCAFVLLPGDQGERAVAGITRARMHQIERELQPIVDNMVKAIKNMTPTTTTTSTTAPSS